MVSYGKQPEENELMQKSKQTNKQSQLRGNKSQHNTEHQDCEEIILTISG
jgi:hypothetical protein